MEGGKGGLAGLLLRRAGGGERLEREGGRERVAGGGAHGARVAASRRAACGLAGGMGAGGWELKP